MARNRFSSRSTRQRISWSPGARSLMRMPNSVLEPVTDEFPRFLRNDAVCARIRASFLPPNQSPEHAKPMNLHEYQSKQLFAHYGMPIPRGKVADPAASAVAAAEDLGGNLWVVKAQVHAGGRGKAGGVKLCRTLDEVREAASNMIGMQLVTHQTGPEGLPV